MCHNFVVLCHRLTCSTQLLHVKVTTWTFIPLSVSLWNDLADPVVDGMGLTGFKSRSKNVKSSMARSLPVENLLPQNVWSTINYSQ